MAGSLWCWAGPACAAAYAAASELPEVQGASGSMVQRPACPWSLKHFHFPAFLVLLSCMVGHWHGTDSMCWAGHWQRAACAGLETAPVAGRVGHWQHVLGLRLRKRQWVAKWGTGSMCWAGQWQRAACAGLQAEAAPVGGKVGHWQRHVQAGHWHKRHVWPATGTSGMCRPATGTSGICKGLRQRKIISYHSINK